MTEISQGPILGQEGYQTYQKIHIKKSPLSELATVCE